MRERLKKKPNEVVCKVIFEPAILDDSKRSFNNMMKVNMAHVLMLYKQKVINEESASQLLTIMNQLKKEGIEVLELNPEYEDLYFNVEKYIIDQVGLAIGGKMHTARSRNDLTATVTRMNVRDEIIKLYDLMINTERILLVLAEENIETVLSGYTHMQPAQPITLSHYLIGIIEALQRDFQRLLNSYNRLNLCPLGGGAFAGTSFNIDRHYVSELLGFNNVIGNSIDAVASRDYLLEIMSDLAICGSTISRFVNDLYIWSTDEFRYIEVDDTIAACSSIMPQKKNPITIEHIKAKTSYLISSLVGIFGCLKNIPYSHCRDSGSESPREFWVGIDQMKDILELLNVTMLKITIKQDHMAKRVNKNFSTVTELADELVRREGISFRKAHEIVGSLVLDSVSKSLDASQITADMLNVKCKDFGEEKIFWTQEELTNVLDSKTAIKKKNSLGGPSPKQSKLFLEGLRKEYENNELAYKAIKSEIIKSEEHMVYLIKNILKG